MFLAYVFASGFSIDVVEAYAMEVVQWVRLFAEFISILIIVIGIVATVYKGLRLYRCTVADAYDLVRFSFSRYLVMALEFELAADIMGTAISPTWDQLGKLAVIATVRTFLNFFLQYEMKGEKDELKDKPINVKGDGERS
jgi:uncharacterized membrane protein